MIQPVLGREWVEPNSPKGYDGLMINTPKAVSFTASFTLTTIVAGFIAADEAPKVDSPAFPARVIAITDGDTLTVLQDCAQVKIRLHGIDALRLARTSPPGPRKLPPSLPSARR
jgi:endonuclease YncB( thermonuclease family)